MPRIIRTLSLLLTLSLFLASCLSPQGGGPQTVDGGQPTPTYSTSDYSTPTPLPQHLPQPACSLLYHLHPHL